MRLVLDESVDLKIEEKLQGRDIETDRPSSGISDQEVLQYAVSQDSPLLTRDQGDYVQLDHQIGHPGILIDGQMHLRDRTLVADTVKGIIEKYSEELEDEVIFISGFYGRF